MLKSNLALSNGEFFSLPGQYPWLSSFGEFCFLTYHVHRCISNSLMEMPKLPSAPRKSLRVYMDERRRAGAPGWGGAGGLDKITYNKYSSNASQVFNSRLLCSFCSSSRTWAKYALFRRGAEKRENHTSYPKTRTFVFCFLDFRIFFHLPSQETALKMLYFFRDTWSGNMRGFSLFVWPMENQEVSIISQEAKRRTRHAKKKTQKPPRFPLRDTSKYTLLIWCHCYGWMGRCSN